MKNALLIFLLLVCSVLRSQNTIKFNPEIGSPKAKINDVSWIAGHWLGEALGGETEEIWTPPLGNSMMCAFKLVVTNKI